MENLIPVINELQDVFATAGVDAIALPQIAVVGIQSSGKTSVLESFVGESFLPRGEGLVTRCPIILQLVYDPNCIEKWCEFHHRAGQRFTDFETVEREIRNQMEQLAGANCGIVDKPIRLKVHSSTVVDLTVVDLPGIVKIPVGDQEKNIEEAITNMILGYIKNENCIILAICAADQDLPTSDAIKLARQVDPTGSRTMTVLTKLDRLEDIKLGHKILSGRLISMKHGIVGVVNRSRADVEAGKSIRDAKLNERIYLQDNYPMLDQRNGSEYLANQLSTLLKGHVIERLHKVEEAIASLAEGFQRKMEALGGLDLPLNKSQTLVDVIMDFADAYKAEIDGKTRNIQRGALYAQVRISHVFERIFAQKLADIDPLENLTDEEIRFFIFNSRGLASSMYPPEDAYQTLISDQLQRFREPSLLCAELVNVEMQRLINNCIESEPVKDVVLRFPKLREELVRVATELLSRQMKIARERVEEHIKSLSSFIRTYSPEFRAIFEEHMANIDLRKPLISDDAFLTGASDPIYIEEEHVLVTNGATTSGINFGSADHDLVNGDGDGPVPTPRPAKANARPYQATTLLRNRSVGGARADVDIVRILMGAYFENERKKIQDQIPRILVHHVVYYTQQQIGRELTNSLHTPSKADELIQISDQILEERAMTSDMLEKLKRGAQIIRDVRAGGK